MADVRARHMAAGGAFWLLRAMGAAVVDGPMFTGRVHGPWRPGTAEWEATWS